MDLDFRNQPYVEQSDYLNATEWESNIRSGISKYQFSAVDLTDCLQCVVGAVNYYSVVIAIVLDQEYTFLWLQAKFPLFNCMPGFHRFEFSWLNIMSRFPLKIKKL